MTSIAYFAGFFDGEGTVDIRQRRMGKYQRLEVRCAIYQMVIEPLEEIKNQYGGSIAKYNKVNRLVISGDGMKRFLRDIRPHLIVKADEVGLALAFLELSELYPKRFRATGGYEVALPETVDQRVIYMHELRAVRERKGICISRRKAA